MRISAVVPTRGDVDLRPLVENFRKFPEIDDIHFVCGDTPHNRYIAARGARHPIILTCDDDCVTDFAPLIKGFVTMPEHDDLHTFVNAMTGAHAAQYPGQQTLLGFGTIFHICLIEQTFFERSGIYYIDVDWYTGFSRWVRDDLFLRESDRIFATVNKHVTVFPAIEILPCAHNPNRLWKHPEHIHTRFAMEHRIKEVTGIVP